MSVPLYHEMFNPLLQALHELGGSATISELEEKTVEIMNLSEDDISEIHSESRTEFSYRLAWARSYLKKYNLIENSSRGVWSLTTEGWRIKSVDSDKVIKAYRYYLRKDKVDIKEEIDEEIETTWQNELIDIVKKMKPEAFERLCQRLLRESGFTNVEVTKRSGDGGIDGQGVLKIGGLLSFNVIFQSKRYKGSVPPSVVRDFRGAMVGRADKGLIITTGTFTREAKLEAKRDGAPLIDLIDGEELVEKLKELSIGVKVEERIEEDVIINKEWFKNL
ncbi:MAG: restriction endonuclease [Deltaproteobacteria bacterium]|uniref:Restriction endonuclease n=1 Tax=Candidatus Zymogenus saltonus TaxID=2844893 RepID=A0A9D8KDT1_9DELT|nr:restriction endonuclease [Candidatus Zymogenus saltonus]